MAKKKEAHNIFKFRVIIDAEEDVFRDIEIHTDHNFLDFHKAILDAFDFEDGEMASFYVSDEKWEKGLEVPLMDMGEGKLTMSSTSISELVSKPADKLLYVYDFLRMWCFYVELIEVKKEMPSTIYPKVALAFGDAPSQDSKEMDLFGTEFSAEELDLEGLDDEEEDEFGSGDVFDEDEFDGGYKSDDDDTYY
ncbi:MAG: hypothetical protein RL220_410 [Bacteroidota bacterium]|jgi:hypothetical protein